MFGLPWWLSGKESPCSAGDTRDTGSIPESGRSPGGGHDSALQYSCLENPMDRGAWATVHRVGHDWSDWAPIHVHTGKSLIQPVFKYLSHGRNIYGIINDMLQTTFLVTFSFFPLFHIVGVISLSLLWIKNFYRFFFFLSTLLLNNLCSDFAETLNTCNSAEDSTMFLCTSCFLV